MKQMLYVQAARTDLFKQLFPKAHNSECKIYYFLNKLIN